MSKPYTDKIKGNTKIRVFEADIESDELVWHRDRADRLITVIEGDDWMFQMDNEIPKLLEAGDTLSVSKMEYHRLYKVGNTPLKIQIEEPMKKFKTFFEEQGLKEGKYIGKTAVYATKDTSGGGTTSFKSKSKIVKHDKKYDVLTLADGTKVNIKLHHRKDKQLYNQKDFYIESTLNYARTRKEIEKDRNAKNISKTDKDTLGKIAKLMASLEEESVIDEAYTIDTTPWQFSNKGVPKGKGNWAFDYVASLDSGGISALQKDTFMSKAQSTYKDAIKQLIKFLKKDLKVKPKDIKIKLAL